MGSTFVEVALASQSIVTKSGEKGVKVLEGKDLSYRYPGATKPVFEGINLFTNVDEMIAIVGPHGHGEVHPAPGPRAAHPPGLGEGLP